MQYCVVIDFTKTSPCYVLQNSKVYDCHKSPDDTLPSENEFEATNVTTPFWKSQSESSP